MEKHKNDQIALEGIRFAHSTILMHEGAFDWSKPAAGRHYQAVEGDQMMSWKKRGYDMILEVLLKRYPNPKQKLEIENKLFLSKKVTQITWNTSKVTTKLSDGTSQEADHVIFTPSIGVLTHKNLFEPEVPSRKQEAINALGLDGIIKIILYFPQKWWKDDDATFFFLWNKEDLSNVKNEFEEGPIKDGISWVSNLVAFVKVPSNPNVLIGWYSGDLIPDVEKLSPEIIKKGAMYVINKFLGHDYNITEAGEILT